MSDIEKEFFEAFGIEPSTCTLESLITKGFRSTQPFDDYTKNELALDRIKIIEYFYPPITSDIVLNLFKIILDNGKDLLFTRDTDNRYLVRKNVVMRELDWHSGNNIQDIILSFCIEYKNELFDDVRALFNEL